MNKYQEFILEKGFCCLSTDLDFKKIESLSAFVENDKFSIKQDDNYNIKKYNLLIVSHSIESIEIDGKKYEKNNLDFKNYDSYIVIPLDFDDKVSKITFNFVNSIADPLTLSLNYIETDHSIFDSKIQKDINAKIKPEHKTGADLVNIYWNLVSDKVDKTVITLYLVTQSEDRIIAKYKETESMFKSITGLAYGNYKYEITEYDDKGNELARTEKISFRLSKPNYSGRKPVIIH